MFTGPSIINLVNVSTRFVFTSLHIHLIFDGFRFFSFPWFILKRISDDNLHLFCLVRIIFLSSYWQFSNLVFFEWYWQSISKSIPLFLFCELRVVISISLTTLCILEVFSDVILEKKWIWNIHLIESFNKVIERPY